MNTGITKGQIQFIKELHQKEGRNVNGLFLVEGEKMVEELKASNLVIHSIYHTSDYQFLSNDLNVESFQISEKELGRISTLKSPNKVLAVVKYPTQESITSEKVIFCCNIHDPGNAGTIVRIADWYGIKNVVFSSGCADVFSSKVVQATMGSIFRVNFQYDFASKQLVELKRNGYKIYAADMVGISVNEMKFESKAILILGSESHGISEEYKLLIDEFVTIPRVGEAESLNVAVACGIICHKMIFN